MKCKPGTNILEYQLVGTNVGTFSTHIAHGLPGRVRSQAIVAAGWPNGDRGAHSAHDHTEYCAARRCQRSQERALHPTPRPALVRVRCVLTERRTPRALNERKMFLSYNIVKLQAFDFSSYTSGSCYHRFVKHKRKILQLRNLHLSSYGIDK